MQVGLESLSPPEIDWGLLEGTWRLLYTTAPDVLPLVRPQLLLGPLPLPFQVGGGAAAPCPRGPLPLPFQVDGWHVLGAQSYAVAVAAARCRD